MYFEFEDHRPETPTIESAISRREGILLSIAIHCIALTLMVMLPRLPVFQQMEAARQAELLRQLEEQRQRQDAQFVFVQPRAEFDARRVPLPNAEASDRDRTARAPERATNPANSLPFSRGNTSERVDAERVPEPRTEVEREARARGRGQSAAPPAGDLEARGNDASPGNQLADAREGLQLAQPPANARRGAAGAESSGGALGDALRNIERYVTPEVFQNLRGGTGDYGPFIDFDSKGVEFGPWIRRFVAQVRRNWFVPYAAWTLKGRVVITFFVHKDGTISDLRVLEPSSVESFAQAAYNALIWSNPTQPLPPEYPDDRVHFTVTFFYNETPPAQ